ncbi:hypothetical protein [Streptomyces anulatus]|uniref:hypothetical protein n=1 Tax=Streptomyces anulatus TaxID=1892 RepID=UPI002ED0D398|nr:hypothetical protein OG703_33755 [Streptomyces anulatus]
MIQYSAFRTWQAMHKRSNNSILALSVGAYHIQKEMNQAPDPKIRASTLLNAVPQTERLDVTVADATKIFGSAAADMAVLAIPQVMALHIELCVGTIKECQRFPALINKRSDPSDWSVPTLHETLRFGKAETVADELLGFCLKWRNAMMHGAGKVNRKLINRWNRLSPAAVARWESLAGRPFTYTKVDMPPTLGWPEIMATLAVTKESAYEINGRVRGTLTRAQWAEVIARDYRDSTAVGRRRFNAAPAGHGAAGHEVDRAVQRLQGHAMTYYRDLAMTPVELKVGRDAVR